MQAPLPLTLKLILFKNQFFFYQVIPTQMTAIDFTTLSLFSKLKCFQMGNSKNHKNNWTQNKGKKKKKK